MKAEEVAKRYFRLNTQILDEKQFNKKIELNGKINRFKRDHGLSVKTNDPIVELFVDGKKIATIRKQYASRKVDMSYKELKKKILILGGNHATDRREILY